MHATILWNQNCLNIQLLCLGAIWSQVVFSTKHRSFFVRVAGSKVSQHCSYISQPCSISCFERLGSEVLHELHVGGGVSCWTQSRVSQRPVHPNFVIHKTQGLYVDFNCHPHDSCSLAFLFCLHDSVPWRMVRQSWSVRDLSTTWT